MLRRLCILLGTKSQRIIGYTSIVFTLLLLFNTILWKDGGMYVNNSGQMSFELGTKTSLTEYQIAACGFIGTYFTLLPKHKKKNAVILGLCVEIGRAHV